MTLVEREAPLRTLTRLLADAATGRGRTALVSGPIAVGKSTLLDAFTEAAAETGATVLTAVASAEERGIALGVMGQLLLTAPLTDTERAVVEPLLAPPTSPGPGGEPAGGPGPATAQRLCAVLLALAARHPVALVVDDVDQADPASLACLSHLTRRLHGARITAVFGHSDQPSHRHTDFRTELLRRPNTQALPLALLSEAAIAELTTARLGRAAAGRWAAEVHRISGGNPLLAGALLDDQPDVAPGTGTGADAEAPGTDAGTPDAGTPGTGTGTGATAPLAVGDGYGQAVVTCLRRGEPLLSRVAQGLAVLGAPRSVDRLLGLDATAVAQARQVLEAAGLLSGGGAFRHPAARTAVLRELGAEQRTELNRRAAEIARADGETATVVADHLVATGSAQQEWTVPVLEEAAAAALAEGAVDNAIAYLKLACEAAREDEPRLARLRTALVRAEWRINPSAPVPHLSELTDALHRGHLRGDDAVVLAKALLWHGRFDDARDVLLQVGQEAFARDPQTLAELRTTRPWLRCSYTPFLDYVPPLDPEPAGHSTPTAAVSWRLEAANALDSVLSQGPSEQVVAEAERILRSARLDDMGMDTVESALLALTYGERVERAAPWCDSLIKEAVSRQSPGRQARLATIRAEICLRQGDLPGAERHAREALEIIPVSGWGVAVGASLGSLLTALTAMGRYDEAVDHLDQSVPDAMLQSRYGLHYLQARGRYQLAAGHLGSALGDFRTCGELMGRWGLDVPGLIAWRTEAAEAHLGMGDRDEARRLTEEQLNKCGPGPSRAKGVALRLLAATYELRQRPALLRKAADTLHEAGDRYELARALTDLTQAYHDLGELRRARMVGRRAWNLAQEIQARPLTRLLGADLGQTADPADPAEQEPPTGAESVLSAAERRVAELAVHGYSNREIAKRLYVTVSTVEQHLTRAYRKLKVGSRAELAAVMSSLIGVA
jgi:DNA-binding CsgD family transcriptional regulator